MTNNIYLQDNVEFRLVEAINSETVLPPPDLGVCWSSQIDGVQWPCETLPVDNPVVAPDGRTLMYQNVVIQRIGKEG